MKYHCKVCKRGFFRERAVVVHMVKNHWEWLTDSAQQETGSRSKRHPESVRGNGLGEGEQ